MPARGSNNSLLFVTFAFGVILAAGCDRKSPAQPETSVAAPIENVRVFNLSGELTNPFQASNAVATVFIFVATDCPISNRYAPEVQRLHAEFSPRGVAFWLVYADRTTTSEAIQKHLKDYGYAIPALRDTEHSLVKRTGATVTPEAVVFGRNREIAYRGRIDDRYVELGQMRRAATRKDLQETLAAMLAGKPVPVPTTRAIGCHIPD
ncbi:MAG TPA: redoxin family protein [Verrucomicrobiae bacterium]|nr:redoxin family protein [Verrucomicrobiae bacterium]